MAGKISAKGAVINLDDSAGSPQNISAAVVSYEIKQMAGEKDVTGFQPVANFIPGLPVYEVVLDVLFDSTATTGAWTVLKGILNSTTSKTLAITPEVGGQTLSGEYMLTNLPVKGAPADALKIGQVTFKVMGAVAPAWA